jgi:type I restriction enzyme, S subunit
MDEVMKYEKYKPSGYEWIGDVPEHWSVKRLKHLGAAIIGMTYGPNDVSESEEDMLVLRSSNIQEGVLTYDDCVYITKEIPQNLITKVGDILICARNGSADLVGKNAVIDERSAGHTFGAFMSVFRSKNWRFLSYFFNSPIFTSQTGLYSTTTINQLTSHTLNNLKMAFPWDEKEQELVASYLDEETQKLDTLIANKKAQVEKLKELRQIEINNAVTKGLDKKVELKDSGIDWLGKIPKHWKVKRLKDVASKITDGEHIAPNFTESGMPFLSAKDIRENEILFEEDKFVSEQDGYKFRQRCNPEVGDALVVSRGATVGRVSIVKTNRIFCLLGSVILIKPIRDMDSEFLYYALTNPKIQENLFQTSQSSAQQAIYLINISFLTIAIPPKKEQTRIAEHLKSKTNTIDELIRNTEQQIEKLTELRKIKIYEAVTGKIKVPAYEQAIA